MPHACEVMMDIYLSFEHTKFTFSINEYPEAFGPDAESRNIEITPLKTQLSSPLKIFTMYHHENFPKIQHSATESFSFELHCQISCIKMQQFQG